MEEYGRIPVYKSSPMLRGIRTGSVRSYDSQAMDYTDGEDDDYGFKSFPEYALQRLFSRDASSVAELSQSVNTSDMTRSIPRIVMSCDSPTTLRKKRKAPDPPSGLVAARLKFPSSDDIVDQKARTTRLRNTPKMRPTSLSPNPLVSSLWEELLVKMNTRSPSPNGSPRPNRTKTILSKLRSPKIMQKGMRRKRLSPRNEEEAGFTSLPGSNSSSFDEPDGAIQQTLFFALLAPDLHNEADFEVQRIPEYDKYLNELLQETDPGHPDYDHLSRAAAKVRHMVKEREDELGNMDNQKRMDRVQDKFPHDDLELDLQRKQLQASRRKSAPGAVLFKTLGKSRSSNSLLQPSMGKKDMEFFRPLRQNNNFNRQYLMEGIVEFSSGMQTQDRYLFLFSDLLLVAKQKSNTTFKLKHRIRVCELWIADCIDDITELTRPTDRSFVIGWPTTNYVATFRSLDLKETWLIKFREQIQEERSKLLPKSLPLEVHHREGDKACQVEVETVTNVVAVITSCLEQLNISDTLVKDYQLWVRLGSDETPYPLCGHELPYAIKLNHIRDFGKRTEDNLTELEIQRIMEEMQANSRKYEFFLKHKKSQKRQSIEEPSVKQSKGKRKSPLINIFRRNRDEKKPHGKLFGHKLSDSTSPEHLIAKPVKELLTILFREGPYTIGILRKSCNARILKEVRQKLDDGEDCLANGTWPSLVIGALLKDYLRNIPQSLLMEDLFDDWIMANSCTDPTEKNNKLKDTLSKLPEPHYELLRHLVCVLYHIDQKSEENKMTAYNLSVCIAPSLLWPKGNNDPLATPPAIFQHMIKSCPQVFGSDSIHLFGDIVEQKIRQDSSTDSDSMHSVLSSHGNFRRDDSSLDSLDREILYSGEMDPAAVTKSHLSPSNLSGDSGLISDSQYYEEDGNGNDIGRGYTRSTSYIHPDVAREEIDQTSRSLDSQYFYQYDPQNPVPPPRRTRRKGSDQNGSPNMEYDRKPNRYMAETVFNVPNRYNKRYNQNLADKFKRRSTESLKSVEESSEADSDMNMKAFRRPDIGTLFKSASGAHLYFEEPSLMEFDDINIAKNRRHLYKQSSEGAMPMSPQSKYSLSSSRDSVLSDSSGSYLNRQNSPDPLSSSAETPEQEESGMSAWLTQQSKHTAYTAQTHRQQISHDDSEIGVKLDRKPTNAMNYLVSPKSSPKTSPKLRRRSPIPLAARKSFPLSVETSPKGSGSNTSKEAEDIIKSHKLTSTYYSHDALDKQDFETSMKEKDPSPQLDIYNNNAQLAMKQLNIYSSGLQGTSPPPRVILQGLNSQSQTPRRENTPMKGNHEILSHARRNSFDTAQFMEHKQKYPMEENSISSEEQDDSDSETEYETRVMTMVNIPISYNIPKKVLLDNSSSSTDSLSRSSSQSEDLGVIRPENPPGYAEAVQRSNLLRQGLLSPEENSDVEVETVKLASLKAKQLYEQSMKQYQEQAIRFSLPSQKFEKILDVHEEHVCEEDAGSITDSSEDEQPEYDPRKLYEESLKLYLEEQSSRSPLVKMSSADRENISLSKNKGGNLGTINKLSPHASSLHRSSSDAGDLKPRRSPLNRSRDTTPTRRPELPPPYNDPPPYHIEQTESSPHSARRHLFPLAGEPINKSAATQKSIDVHISPKTVSEISSASSSSVNRPECSKENAQIVSVPKCRDSILVSNKARSLTTSAHSTDSGSNNATSRITDYSIHSAQSEIGKYRSPRSRVSSTRSPSSSKSNLPITNVDHSQSNNVFRQRASSLEPQEPRATLAHPKTSSQGQISYRNPKVSSRVTEVGKCQPSTLGVSARRNSLDAAVSRNSIGVQKELPWSVKRLSNIFAATTPIDSHDTPNDSHSTNLQSHSFSPVPKSSSSSSSSRVPPQTFQRYNDDIRSSTSSNSSRSSSSTVHSKPMSRSKPFNKFGPQARDSFSSADESDCSCRYSLNCRIDNCNVEELADINFTDITYV